MVKKSWVRGLVVGAVSSLVLASASFFLRRRRKKLADATIGDSSASKDEGTAQSKSRRFGFDSSQRSPGSVSSIGSIGSFCSIGSIGSACSVGSFAWFASFASALSDRAAFSSARPRLSDFPHGKSPHTEKF
jgi:hypothetical protein